MLFSLFGRGTLHTNLKSEGQKRKQILEWQRNFPVSFGFSDCFLCYNTAPRSFTSHLISNET